VRSLQIDKVAKVGKLKIGGSGLGNLEIFEIRKIVLMGYWRDGEFFDVNVDFFQKHAFSLKLTG
jgi:hypothetical protein